LKISFAALLTVLLFALFSGCGGSNGHNILATTKKTGRATFTVKWPQRVTSLGRSRLIPDASNSIKVEIKNGNVPVTAQTLPRPASGGSSTATFNTLPVGSLTVTATAYPQTNGTGTAQAIATTPLVIQSAQNTPFSLTMASTIDHLELTASTSTLAAGGSLPLALAAKDASGVVVLLSPAKLQWTSSNPAAATVDNTGKVTGLLKGATDVSVNDTESGKSATISLTVSAAIQMSVAYQIDATHAGHAVFGTALTFPSSPTWSIDVGGDVSYPLIANGMVYIMSNNGGLYALDKATGSLVWGPVNSGRSHAYDRGKIFTLSLGGTLQSFDAATGQPGWSVQLPGQYSFDATPTAVNGIVYAGGAGSGGTVYAVDETNGALLWTASVANGDQSSPAISKDGLFVSYPCQVYKFDPISGAPRWHYNGPCDGGGGRTTAYDSGQLYSRDLGSGTIFDAATGAQIGTFPGGRIPALSPNVAYIQDGYYFQGGGTLRAVDRTNQQVLWSFAGDGALSSAPLLIDQTVIVGSNSGTVYALDAASGQTLWSGSAGAAIPYPDEQNVSQPLTGFAAGEGYLIVAAGHRLTAWSIVGP
jgi:outer membrane protein assembly factor BamB